MPSMRHRHQPVKLTVQEPHLGADVFRGKAPRPHADQVILEPAFRAILEGVAQLNAHSGSHAQLATRSNIYGVDDRVDLSKQGLRIFAKRRHSPLKVMPIVLRVLFQHATRLAVDLRHAGCHIESGVIVGRRTTDDRHARHSVRQKSTERERMRTTARPTERREPVYAEMVEHARNIRRVIADGPAGLWV